MTDHEITGGVEVNASGGQGTPPTTEQMPPRPGPAIASLTRTMEKVAAIPSADSLRNVDLSKLGLSREKKADEFTYEVRMFGNHQQWVVQEHVLMTGAFPEGYIRFKGMCTQKFQLKGPMGQAFETMQPLQFDIPGATTLADAWAFFDGVRQAEACKVGPMLQAQVDKQSSRIAVPGGPPGMRRR